MSLLRDIFIFHNEAVFKAIRPAHCSTLATDYLCQFTFTLVSDTEYRMTFFQAMPVCHKPFGDR